MKRLVVPGLACALAFAFTGCGPMQAPLPRRLDPESQQKVDDGWNKAFTPVGRFDHQGLLDLMVGARAYQLGVDHFSLRSEKRFAGGKIVMEVQFDRAKPNGDRFEVTVYDSEGKLVRSDRYPRSEVEESDSALFVNPPPVKDMHVVDRPEVAVRRAEYEGRWNRILEIFPKPNTNDDRAPPPHVKQ